MTPRAAGHKEAAPRKAGRLDLRLVAILAAVNLADGLLTMVGLSRGAHEVAPVASALPLGPLTLIGLGLIGLIVQLTVLAWMPRQFRAVGWFVVLGLGLVPVINNLLVLS